MTARTPILHADGTIISVQASSTHYCSPKSDAAFAYRAVDILIKKPNDPEWNNNAGEPTHQAFCSTAELMELILKGGGIVGGQLPPLDFGNEYVVMAQSERIVRMTDEWYFAQQREKELAQKELEQQIHDAGYPEGGEEE